MSLELEKLSTHNWSAPGVPSQTSQVQEEHASQQEGHVQIMYCKDQVYQEDAEFSFEELRAQRHYKSLSERASHLQKLKQDLQCQIEEKQRLIQQRHSTAEKQQVHHPLYSVSEVLIQRFLWRDMSVEVDRYCGSDAKLQKTAKPFTVFDENTLTNKTSSSANRNSLKLPTLSLKGPKSKAEFVTDKDASISRSEEAIINSHRNKTLCRSPEDTCEFARAAQLASSPFAGVERTKASESGLTENLSRTAPESTKAPNSNASAEEKKLSPILEISQEWGGTFSHNSMKCLKEPEISRTADTPEEAVTESEDVCGLNVRSRLFHQADVTSFSNFQRKTGRLPDTSGDDLRLGIRKTHHSRVFTVTCCLSQCFPTFFPLRHSFDKFGVKVDWSGVPWDFFISSQLRSRRSRDEPDADVQICCYVFENGCVTLWRIPHGDTLQDLLSEPSAADDVSLLVALLLELVKQFHSCRVVHGGLKPESLYFYLSGITALDFSNSVDLQLQTDVTTAQALPSAQKYIQQGLLSPSASPYQVDLISVAEVVHMLLFNRSMKVKQENSAWSLDEGSGSQHSAPVEPLWKDFFRMILNPEQKSSELVLSELISNVRNSL
ncbi:mitotic checkpoint serine/threonine-protein kinase BUB1 beta-like [Sinocyclocheilus rhinocerous]|uniref:mitotic checkpoint serine/threonine-protein kinase BUB1 beta-like n=1 Tax=Sinocyclocheilus rhinocerous TaxID=307959 RepID=UPI0007B9FE1C|nr:PREDICTED: mitotic checkpoint serine/threonine-protein kinase BUB1 beta-like [Sinocyclocheilus rhinocerous]